MVTASKPNALKVARQITNDVNAMLIAQAASEVIAEQIEAMDAELLAARVYTRDEQYRSESDTTDRITDSRATWTMIPADFEAYQQTRDDRIAADGWNVERGYCPKLVAEMELLQLQNVAIDAAFAAMGEQLTHLRLDNEQRDKMLDCITGLVVTAPGYRKPA